MYKGESELTIIIMILPNPNNQVLKIKLRMSQLLAISRT